MNINSNLIEFLKKNPKWIIYNIILILLNYPLEIVVISYLSGQIFSKINNLSKNFNSLKILFFQIIIIYLILEFSITIKDRIDITYYPKLERELRLGIVDTVLKKIEINYDALETGDLVSRLLKVPIHTYLFVDIINKYLLPFLITFLIVIGYLFFINKKLGLIMSLAIIIYSLIFIYLVNKNIKNSIEKEKKENKLMSDIDDILQNSINILTTGQTQYEKQNLINIHQTFEENIKKEMSSTASIKMTTAFMNILIFVVLIVFSLYFFYKGEITPALTISIITLSMFLIKHLRVLSRRICDGSVFFGKMMDNNKFLNSLEAQTHKDGEQINFIKNGKIEFKDVSFSYNGKKEVLKNKNLDVNPRDCVVFLGHSGKGKTTAIKLILGFYEKDNGEILVDNVDISKIKREYLRSKISFVNQKSVLFNKSVLYNIQYGTNKNIDFIKHQIEKMGIMSIFTNLPNGLETSVGKFGDKLSGGQKQIVLLLRCYFRENPIVLLDEPTASVDDKHKEFVYKIIYQINKQSTVVIVTHDIKLANLVPKKIYF